MSVDARTRFVDLLIALAVIALVVATVRAVSPIAAQPPADLFEEACEGGSGNPYIATTFAQRGGRQEREMAILAFRAPPEDGNPVTLATVSRVGACYGLGYDGQTETLYAAALHKRGTHFGPAGPGGIYAVNVRTGNVRTFATVPNAGTDPHQRANDYHPDVAAREPTGKNSLGDLDISPDFSELSVVNLFDRRIYRYSLADGQLLGSFANGAAAEPWAEDARPYGLGYRGDRLYHGVVNSAQSSQNFQDLEAFVYESAYDGSAMRQVASAKLHFERGWIWPNEGRAIWLPWKDPPGSITTNSGRYPQPMLSDIVFTDSGDQMILGFRDRFGDMVFYTTPPNQPPPGEFYYNTPAGDILPAWPEGDQWRIQTDPEYYRGDYGPQQGNHDETSFGGLAVIPGQQRVVMSANSPLDISSGGAVWLRTDTGRDVARVQIYKFGQGDNFGKANGLGDVEVLCPASETETATPTTPATETVTPTATDTETPTATTTVTPTVATATVATPTVVTPTATLVTPTPTMTITQATATAMTPTWTPTVPTIVPTTPAPTATGVAPTVVTPVPSPTSIASKATPEDTPRPGPTSTLELPTLPKTGTARTMGASDPALLAMLAGLGTLAAAFAIWLAERRGR